jgi:prepilin-type N-terminal cleavage/methylation domain-containing protein
VGKWKSIYQKLQNKRVVSEEKGMTMIEVLTALVLLTMVTMLLSSFLFMGISMYKRVTATTQIRNQGDALISQVISYFRDVEFVSTTPDDKINIVKRAYDAGGIVDGNIYINNFTMSIEQDADGAKGILVTDSSGTAIKHFSLPAAYKLIMPAVPPAVTPPGLSTSSISVKSPYLIEVHLVYEKVTGALTNASLVENPTYEINTQIPLFRSE